MGAMAVRLLLLSPSASVLQGAHDPAASHVQPPPPPTANCPRIAINATTHGYDAEGTSYGRQRSRCTHKWMGARMGAQRACYVHRDKYEAHIACRLVGKMENGRPTIAIRGQTCMYTRQRVDMVKGEGGHCACSDSEWRQ